MTGSQLIAISPKEDTDLCPDGHLPYLCLAAVLEDLSPERSTQIGA